MVIKNNTSTNINSRTSRRQAVLDLKWETGNWGSKKQNVNVGALKKSHKTLDRYQ